jgi:hypothetical protein
MDIDIEVSGLGELVRDLRAAPGKIRKALKSAAETTLRELRKPLSKYPAPRANQVYERTYHLRDQWLDAEPAFVPLDTGFEFKATLTNDVRSPRNEFYASFVQGDEGGPDGQSRWHIGRWKQARDIAQDADKQVEKEFDKEIQQVLNQIG